MIRGITSLPITTKVTAVVVVAPRATLIQLSGFVITGCGGKGIAAALVHQLSVGSGVASSSGRHTLPYNSVRTASSDQQAL
jgi:hypothetical protein